MLVFVPKFMLHNLHKKIIFISTALSWPVFVGAQFTLAGSTFASFIYEIVDILDLLIPVMMTAAGVVFFWGLSKVVLHSGSSTEVANGRNYILWGIIALFCLISLSAIISFVQGELGFGVVEDRGIILLPGGP